MNRLKNLDSYCWYSVVPLLLKLFVILRVPDSLWSGNDRANQTGVRLWIAHHGLLSRWWWIKHLDPPTAR